MLKSVRNTSAFVTGLVLSVFAGVASATVGDYDTITAAVDWTSAGTAVVAVAALVAAVLVLIRGSRIVLSMIRR